MNVSADMPTVMQRLSLALLYQESAKPGWLKAFTFHTGSKEGNDPKYKEQAEALGPAIAKHTDIRLAAFGGGLAGNMGHAAESCIEHDIRLVSASLAFFLAAQGEDPEGVIASVAVDNMHKRMRVMRNGRRALKTDLVNFFKMRKFNGTQAAISLPGGFGTIEETLEQLVSRNGIVNRHVMVGYDGYWDGLKHFLRGCSDNGYRDGSDVKRIQYRPDVVEMAKTLADWNSKPAVMEPDAKPVKNQWDAYVKETEDALIVRAGAPLTVISELYTLLTSYDVSNIPGQTLFKKSKIKPIIFDSGGIGYYDGLEQQTDMGFKSGFVHEGRRVLLHFSAESKGANRHAKQVKAFRPDELGVKHAEATEPKEPCRA